MNIKHDIRKLKQYCLKQYNFTDYLYTDNNSKILAVAHTDYIMRDGITTFAHDINNNIIFSNALDDRLGLYIIDYCLPQMDIRPDILLTTNEEIMQSTANLFTTNKQYNWIFSFDRAGLDCVLYQYEDNKLVNKLRKLNIRVSIGSYSDIRELENLKCKGLNFGTGYYEPHTIFCHAKISDVNYAIAQFKRFWDKYNSTYLKHTIKPIKSTFVWDNRRYDSKMINHHKKSNESYYAINSKLICIECGLPMSHFENDNYNGFCEDCYPYYSSYTSKYKDYNK